MKRILLVLFIINCSISIAIAQLPNNLNGIKICIDPGHGGNSSNDRPPVFADIPFWESESNFQKALLLRPMLQAKGATVYLTRETNSYPNDADEPSLSARVKFANDNKVDWFHSIHSNALGGTNTNTNYSLVLVKEVIATRQPAFPQAVTMANIIYNNIRAKIRTGAWSGNILPGVALDYSFYGGTNGGFNLGVLNGLLMPGELSEGSFHDNYKEVSRLINNDYRKTEAYGILNAFVEYFNIPFDTLGMIIGSQKNGTVPINNVIIRLLPNNKVYNGDAYNNGFFLFDSLPPGDYKIVYETPGYSNDTVSISLIATAKLIQSTVPDQNQSAVSRVTSIVINFLQPMDTASVKAKFSITPVIDGTITWSNQNKTLTFTPQKLLGFNQDYVVALAGLGNTKQPTTFVDNTTVTTSNGLANYSLSFKTIKLPPVVTLSQPVKNDTNFTVTKFIGIKFSDSMDTTSVNNAISFVPSFLYTYAWSQSNTTILITPVSKTLEYSTNYTLTIDSSAKSIYGFSVDANKDSIPGDPYILKFKTQANPTSVHEQISMLPNEFSLHQNYPNPFNPSTTIEFSIAEVSSVSLKIYDVLGREVTSLVNEKLNQGMYSIVWDAKNYSSGIYFYKLTTEKYTSIKRMMLVK